MTQVRILYLDEHLVVVDKPAGLQVHAPESATPGMQVHAQTLLRTLRKQIQQYLYPVHRLDRATSGVLVMALSSEVAAQLQAQFQAQAVEKTYLLLCRGWTEPQFTVEKDGGLTEFETVQRFEIQQPVGKFASARYSWVFAFPKTGKYHQIRRHLKSVSHPIVGDTVYGDGVHNRFWRQAVPDSGLFLKAYQLKFEHPAQRTRMLFQSRYDRRWHAAFDLSGFCPYRTSSLRGSP